MSSVLDGGNRNRISPPKPCLSLWPFSLSSSRLSMLGIWWCKHGGVQRPNSFSTERLQALRDLVSLKFSLSWALPLPWFPAKELEFAFFWLYPLYRWDCNLSLGKRTGDSEEGFRVWSPSVLLGVDQPKKKGASMQWVHNPDTAAGFGNIDQPEYDNPVQILNVQ